MKRTIILCQLILIIFCSAKAQSIQEAKKLTDNEQYENASSIYRLLLETNPNDIVTYYYYADNLLLSENPDSAKIIFDKASAIDPNNPLVKIGRAKLLLDKISLKESESASSMDPSNTESKARLNEAQKNIENANTLIDAATLNTKDVNVLVESADALVHYKNKNTDKAKLLLDRALKLDDKNIEALLLYGDLYTELNNGTLAADYYNRALDLNKSSARAIVSKGRLYKRSTNYDGAAREFENAITIEPSYAPAHRELGEAYIKLGKLEQAKAEYKKYLELSKNNCSARIRYATFLFASKNYPEALSELDLVSKRCDSNNIVMLRVLTYCYYETKDYSKGLDAVAHLFRVLSPDKRVSKDWEYYGKLLIAGGNDSLGIGQLQKAFELEPSRIDILYDIANTWMNLKQYTKAIEAINQKISSGKDVKVLDYFTLGQAYYFNRQFAEADSAVAKANELSPKWPSAWLYRAKINAQIDSTSEGGLAKPFYEKFIETALTDSLKPDFGAKYNNRLVEAYGYLAYYYILKKDYTNGLLYLKKKLELPLEPEEKKKIEKAIDQIEHPSPKNEKK